jgi:hypothetical protein
MKPIITFVLDAKPTLYNFRHRTNLVLLIGMLSALSVSAQSQKFTDVWKVDVGPFVAVPIRTFRFSHSFGFGVDASATRPIPGVPGLSAGGRFYYGHFLAKPDQLFFEESKDANLVGICAEANYVYQEKFVAGIDLGLGLRFPSFFGSTGFARGAYIGYQLPVKDRTVTVSLIYMNRTTIATQFIGLRGSIRI